MLHARLRKGSSQRGAKRIAEELIAQVRRAGATGELTVRADAGFWNYALIHTLVRFGVRWSVAVRNNPSIRTAIAGIDEEAWTTIAYPDGGQAHVAETTYVTGQGPHRRQLRVRRTRLTETARRRLWPDWRHHAFITNVEGPPSPLISSSCGSCRRAGDLDNSLAKDPPAALVVVDQSGRVAAQVGGAVDQLGGRVQQGGGAAWTG